MILDTPGDTIFESEGEDAGVFERWKQVWIEVKKFVDDVSDSKKKSYDQ